MPENEIERAKQEYGHVVSELARYEADSQKLVSLVSLTITLAFAVGVAQKIEPLFPLIPLLTLTLIQYLLANNYAYRVREHYVYRLEKILQGKDGSVPALYHSELRRHFLDLSWIGFVLLPFSGALAYTVGLLLCVSFYAVLRASSYLTAKPKWLLAVYIAVCISMAIYTVATAFWSWRKLRSGGISLAPAAWTSQS